MMRISTTKVLSELEMQQVHEHSLDILESTGIRVYSAAVTKLLSKNCVTCNCSVARSWSTNVTLLRHAQPIHGL